MGQQSRISAWPDKVLTCLDTVQTGSRKCVQSASFFLSLHFPLHCLHLSSDHQHLCDVCGRLLPGIWWDYIGSLGMLEYEEMRLPMSSQGVAPVWVSWDLPARGVSRRDIQNQLNCWVANQHWVRWRSLGDTQRQARELISGPGLGAKTKVTSFNRTQSRAVIGLLTGHNTLRRHLYRLGLQDSPLCRKCGVMEETSAHIVCECEALA